MNVDLVIPSFFEALSRYVKSEGEIKKLNLLSAMCLASSIQDSITSLAVVAVYSVPSQICQLVSQITRGESSPFSSSTQ